MRYRDVSKIHVQKQDYARVIEIVPEIEHGDGTYSLGIYSNGSWDLHRFEMGSLIPDEIRKNFLRIPEQWGKEILEELLKIFGHPEKEATAQALESTKYHLEDMRKLVFEQRIK